MCVSKVGGNFVTMQMPCSDERISICCPNECGLMDELELSEEQQADAQRMEELLAVISQRGQEDGSAAGLKRRMGSCVSGAIYHHS